MKGYKKTIGSSSWGSILGLVLLGSAVSAALRIYGAYRGRALLLSYGAAAWKLWWLLLTPVLLLLINLSAFFFLWKQKRGLQVMAWVSFAANTVAYWFERLFVWAPDQKLQGNLHFMIGVFVAYLLLVFVYSWEMKRKGQN